MTDKKRLSHYGKKELQQNQALPPNQQPQQPQAQAPHQPGDSKQLEQLFTPEALLQYLEEYRSAADTKSLLDEGYEIDYDKLVGVGSGSAVFLARRINHTTTVTNQRTVEIARRAQSLKQQVEVQVQGEMAVKIIRKVTPSSLQSGTNSVSAARRNLKTRTGNLKLALALGQTKQENNILQVIDVFKTQERIFIFMQYCPYGNIISFIRRNGNISGKLLQKWCVQIGEALCYMHQYHIAHRNFKLENVLVDEKLDAKLTGFGLSKLCINVDTKQTIYSKSICGSEPYLSPEMLKDASERRYDPRKADVWAYGVGIFLMATLKYPYEGENLKALRQDQLLARYLERDSKRRLRTPVKELLSWTFILEPNVRPGMANILANSSFLNGSHEPSQTTTDQGASSTNRHEPRTANVGGFRMSTNSTNQNSGAVHKISIPHGNAGNVSKNSQQQLQLQNNPTTGIATTTQSTTISAKVTGYPPTVAHVNVHQPSSQQQVLQSSSQQISQHGTHGTHQSGANGPNGHSGTQQIQPPD